MPRNEISRKFLMDPRLNGVIMTGSYRTGKCCANCGLTCMFWLRPAERMP